MNNKNCIKCDCPFQITDSDLAYYEKISPVFCNKRFSIPQPTHCPECRHKRRLAWRNERCLYHRSCDLSDESIISIYSPDKPLTVYDYEQWWSDRYKPLDYGRDVDLSRSFLEQVMELFNDVPHMALTGSNNENCPYCHLIANCKNCYLIVESSNNEDCYYGYWLQKCLGCCDTSFSHECQYCYEVDNCYGCYNLKWSKDCTNCHDSYFLDSCKGCKNCLFSINLAQKEYCIFNEQYSKEDYDNFLSQINFGTFDDLTLWEQKYKQFISSQPRKYARILHSENCTGDYIISSRNCEQCFHAHDAEFCKYAEHVWRDSKYNMDVSTAGRNAELIYEAINVGISAYNVQFSTQCWSSCNMQYCHNCFNSKHCFGCVGLKRNSYCILNQQYTKEEYDVLVSQIVELMLDAGDYGEFFPIELSPFCYNETPACEQFPLEKETALTNNYSWKDKDTKDYLKQTTKMPNNIADIDNSSTKQVLACNSCQKNYKLMGKELNYYQTMNIAAPRLCPTCRHLARMNQRGPNKLWHGKCIKCEQEVETSYDPKQQKNIHCKKCYLTEMY